RRLNAADAGAAPEEQLLEHGADGDGVQAALEGEDVDLRPGDRRLVELADENFDQLHGLLGGRNQQAAGASVRQDVDVLQQARLVDLAALLDELDPGGARRDAAAEYARRRAGGACGSGRPDGPGPSRHAERPRGPGRAGGAYRAG